jgi:hypothetical protein
LIELIRNPDHLFIENAAVAPGAKVAGSDVDGSRMPNAKLATMAFRRFASPTSRSFRNNLSLVRNHQPTVALLLVNIGGNEGPFD